MHVYSPNIPIHRFSGLYIHYPQVLKLILSVSYQWGENTAQLSAAVAIHRVPIFAPTDSHYYWVDRGGVDSKLAQVLYT